MKKQILTLSLALSAAFAAVAQKSEMAKAVVHYKFSHIRDTTAKDKPYTENMILFLGQTASVYKSYDKKLQDEMMRKNLEQQLAQQGGMGNVNIKAPSGFKPTNRNEIFLYPAQNKMVRKENMMMTTYLIEEPAPAIAWKITADTASFGTLHCQKATGHLLGRDYTAWFCPDVPFHAGPWKLNGLPGLIVEAYDTKKEVIFKFDGMEEVVANAKPATDTPPVAQPGMGGGMMRTMNFGGDAPGTDPNLIALPTTAVKASAKEYAGLQEAFKKDPEGFMKSQMAGQGMTFSSGSAGGGMTFTGGGAAPGGGGDQRRMVVMNGSPVGAVNTINNPLELPEKK